MRTVPLVVLMSAACLLSACQQHTVRLRAPGPARFVIDQEPTANPWTHLHAHNDPDAFQFAIVSDRHGGGRPGIYEDAVGKLNLLQPEFVMCVGDLIPGYIEDADEINTQWDEVTAIIGDLEMPFFFVPGNHDISNPAMADVWRERFGRSFYHFVYRDVLFLCLNSEDTAPDTFSEEQIDYVRRVLDDHPDVRWTFAFLHKPYWPNEGANAGWERIEPMLVGRPHTVIAGHLHRYTKYERNDSSYIVLATTGGASGLQGPEHGEFDHVVWVTMAPDGPRIANLMLDGIFDENVFTEDIGRVLGHLLSGNALAVSPIFAEGDTFQGASAQVRLSNAVDQPMAVTLAFEPDPLLAVEPETFDLVVPPGGEATVAVKVRAKRPVATTELPTLTMNWSVRYDLPDREPLSLSGSLGIGVATVSACPKSPRPVVVDGKLDDWGDLPLACTTPRGIGLDPATWLGATDSSFRFGVTYDDANLYIAVETTDDDAYVDTGKLPWQQDGVEVRVDARPEPQRSAGRGANEFRDLLLVAVTPGETPEQMVFSDRDQLPEGVRAICVPTETGHVTEIAIPVAYLDEMQGGDWREFRLNIAVDDFDGPADTGAQIWWRPDWRGEGNYAGSGTFRRQ